MGETPGPAGAEFVRPLGGSVQAAIKAVSAIDAAGPGGRTDRAIQPTRKPRWDATAACCSKGWLHRLGQHEEQDVVRPTGPYDPDLYVLALRRADGKYDGLAFNHSVHNAGHIRQDCLSPCFYGLAALEVERRHGGHGMFLPGALVPRTTSPARSAACPRRACACRRRDQAILASSRPCPAPSGCSTGSSPSAASTRRRGSGGCSAVVPGRVCAGLPTSQGEWFRKMREELAQQGEALVSSGHPAGDIVFVGVPGEMFARLGLELRRRSPFRHVHHRAGQREHQLHSRPQGVRPMAVIRLGWAGTASWSAPARPWSTRRWRCLMRLYDAARRRVARRTPGLVHPLGLLAYRTVNPMRNGLCPFEQVG